LTGEAASGVAGQLAANGAAVSSHLSPIPGTTVAASVAAWESGLRTEVARMLRENAPDVMDELARRFEAAVIREALDFTRGRKVEAAERLGIGRNTITRKIQELNLEP
jgi:two-component system nitrogen regulation response regulator GlnG